MRTAYMSSVVEPPWGNTVPSVMELVMPTVHVVVAVEPHVLAAVSRTYGTQ